MLKQRCFYLLTMLLLFAGCTIPTDPNKNPDNAKIKKENFTLLLDTIPVGTTYKCTLLVALPQYIDNLSFILKKDSIPVTLVSGPPKSDTIKVLLQFLQPAEYTIVVYVQKGTTIDSIVKKVHVFSTTPSAKFLQTKKTIFAGEKGTLSFTMTDPDSNLVKVLVTRDEIPFDSIDVLYSQRFAYDGKVAYDSLPQLKKMTVYSVTGVDNDNQYSLAAVCTLFVNDTIAPVVSIVKPSPDSSFTVAALPCTLSYKIHDNWGVDSVKISGFHQNLLKDSSVVIIRNTLDSGITKDSVEAWDRGGNRTVKHLTITYNGAKRYPPKLKQVIISPIKEHGSFTALNLDSIVTITDSSATYTKDSLKWTIKADSTDPFLTPVFDTLKRTFNLTLFDKEIIKDRYAAYSLQVTDPKGLSSEPLRLTYIALEENDPPVITVSDQTKKPGVPFDTLVLAKCGNDPDPADRISWTISAGKYFKPDSIYTSRILSKEAVSPIIIRPSFFSGKVAIIPDTSKFDASKTTDIVDSLKFTASDGTLTVSKYVKFRWSSKIINFPLGF